MRSLTRHFLLSILLSVTHFFSAETFAKTASVEIFSDYVNWEEMAKARTSVTYSSYTVVDRGMASGTLRISGSGTSDDISFSFETIVGLGSYKYDGNGDGIFDILDPASSYNQTFTGTEQGTYARHGSVVFTVRYEAQRSVNQRTLNVGGAGTVTSSSVPNLNVGQQFSANPLLLEPFVASGTLNFDTSSKSYSADLSRFGESGNVGKNSTFVINGADSLLLQDFPIPNPGGATTYADVTLTRKGNLYHKQIKVGDVSYYIRVTDPNDSDADGIPVVEMREVGNNPENPDDGVREVPFSGTLYIEDDDFKEEPPPKYFRLTPGREVRLRSGYFVTCTGVVKDAAGQIEEVQCTYDPETAGGSAPDGRKVKATIHWVSAEHAVDATVVLYDRLFTAEVPGDATGDPTDDLNAGSRQVLTSCKVEPTLADTPPGDVVQFERLGYFAHDPHEPLLFHRPVGLRDEWSNIQKRKNK